MELQTIRSPVGCARRHCLLVLVLEVEQFLDGPMLGLPVYDGMIGWAKQNPVLIGVPPVWRKLLVAGSTWPLADDMGLSTDYCLPRSAFARLN